jgi:Rrf2 family iron-sulfur cluster assembly transcriptional regulator
MLALARIGKEQDEKPDHVSIAHLAEEEGISSVFLEQIFFRLKKAGIVQSVRGPGGGFSFARPLEDITVKEILDAAGEDLSVLPCDRSREKCNRISSCISHQVLLRVTTVVNEYLSGITMAALVQPGGEWDKGPEGNKHLEKSSARKK